MYIKSLKMENYRCFEKTEVNFDKEYTVLVGVNGAGKSTILDAIATSLGSFIAGFDGIKSNGILHDDAHRKTYELGSRIESEEQYPVVLDAVCGIEERDVEWRRSLHGKSGRTHITDARAIMQYGNKLQDKVRKGDADTILPMIAYYGTGRLYMQKRARHVASGTNKFTRTVGYTDCLDSASNDKQMMRWFKQMTEIQIQEQKLIPELEVVKKAMGMCFSGVENSNDIAKFEYKLKSGEIEIEYKRNGKYEKLPMRMLSDGLKITMSMVADIAYRMAVLNPQLLENILEETPGIVLIDEVDMHLHPQWQKRIVGDLHNIFPKVQFIMTTHSPSVLANVSKEHVLLLEDGEIFVPGNTTYGRDVTAILQEMMKVDVRPKKVVEIKDAYYKALAEEQYEIAKKLLTQLESILGEKDGDVVQAKVAYDLETF
ncbi:MAG: AAA family ATPase [Eubacterium sp.]|nr:AAA family ATPase [Eubacterium sp.]